MNQQDKDRLREYANNLMRFANADFGELVLSLLEENEALARDAGRYRWLRTFNVDSYLAGGKLDALDAAIDAAMQPKGE